MDYLIADEALLERMVRAVEKVRDRLRRAAAALESAAVPYAVAGGNAVAAWVATIDDSAVRNTQDVEIVIHRKNMLAATKTLESAGFLYCQSAGVDMFLDGPSAKARDAVRIVFAGEKVSPEHFETTPDVENPYVENNVRYLQLEALVRMKLTWHRRQDKVDIRDMIDVGLIDISWLTKLRPELADRLQQLLDTPEG
jgi:hypothetical protein